MKTTTVNEFRSGIAQFLTDNEPVLVTRYGKPMGFYIPWESDDPAVLKAKKKRFAEFSEKMAKLTSTIDEKDLLRDFAKWRGRSREARRS